MFKQDSSRFAKMFITLDELYRWGISQATIELYWRIFKPFSFETVRAAIECHTQNPDVGKFPPTPADIIVAIEGSSQNRALIAWSKTMYAMRTIGKYTSIAFDDALIHAVIADMNGWIRLCNTEEKQLPFVAKEFQERYRGYVVKKPSHYRKYFPGLIEVRNTVLDIYPTPKLIGDELKAKEIIATGNNKPFLELTTLSSSSSSSSSTNNSTGNELIKLCDT